MAAYRSITLLLLGLLACSLVPSSALYFHVKEGQQRCFIEEVPNDMLVMAKYNSLDHHKLNIPAPSPGTPAATIRVVIKDPLGNVVLEQDADEAGSVMFTSTIGGEHLVCLKTSTNSWFGASRTFRFQLEFQTGVQATDYSELAKQEHLSAIEVEVRKLNDRVRAIRAEQDYQKSREEEFRNTSESTNSRVMWWSVIQTLVLVASGVWQIFSLKGFFKQKKLA